MLVYNGAGTLTDRMLNGPALNQHFADENGSGVVSWYLTDRAGTVNDVIRYNSGTGVTSVVNHLTYGAFGNITAQSNSANQPLFAYTGQMWDADAGLYYYHARWYDARLGRFLSRDPKSFAAGDTDLYRYVGNSPVNFTDPNGMQAVATTPKLEDFLPPGYQIGPNSVNDPIYQAAWVQWIASLAPGGPSSGPRPAGDSGYFYYLTNPSAMDTELAVGFYFAAGVGATAAAGAGLIVATAGTATVAVGGVVLTAAGTSTVAGAAVTGAAIGAVACPTIALVGGGTWDNVASSAVIGTVSGAASGAAYVGTTLVTAAYTATATTSWTCTLIGGYVSGLVGGGTTSALSGNNFSTVIDDARWGGVYGFGFAGGFKAVVPMAASGFNWVSSRDRPTPAPPRPLPNSAPPTIMDAPRSPKQYSVAFQTQLAPSNWIASRKVHFNRANATLDKALKFDPEFAKAMEALIPDIGKSVNKAGGRTTPSGWTWHHATNAQAGGQNGVLQLVPKLQHTPGSVWWRILHPNANAAGGFAQWAIPPVKPMSAP